MNIHLRAFENINLKNKKDFPEFKAGDTIDVVTKIKDGDKTRLQHFQGIVLQRRHKNTSGETFTIRKVVSGIAIEKIFPILSPIIDSITVLKKGIVRRARLFYLRKSEHKKTKIKMKL